MSTYWDPTSALAEVLGGPPRGRRAPWTSPGSNDQRTIFTGAWPQRDWRNLPGPFYTSETDTCGGGRHVAPDLILVNENWTEFVFRQPASARQVLQLVDAAYDDPFAAYGCDGDQHWTLQSIRVWWRDRDQLLAWIDTARLLFTSEGAAREVASLDQYAADIRGPLEEQLRRYAHWLEQGRGPDPGEPLPDI